MAIENEIEARLARPDQNILHDAMREINQLRNNLRASLAVIEAVARKQGGSFILPKDEITQLNNNLRVTEEEGNLIYTVPVPQPAEQSDPDLPGVAA